ncbi:two-component system, OmpR family, sensor histidine kinase VicK [Anaerolineales bacterium]|nr:two-component system, OmpR family, sensor histidine kinase VicK [Anaerolineales bacterium]
MIDLSRIWISLTTSLAENEEDARREHMTRVIFVMVSIGFLMMSIIVPAFDLLVGVPSYTPIFMMAFLDALMLVAWCLIFRGRWYVSRYLLPAIFLTLGAYIISLVGLISTGVLHLAIAVVLTSMLFGNKVQWLTVAISEMLYLGVGWLTGERDFELFFIGGIVVGSALSGIAALQWFSSALLGSSFERIRRAELASRESAGKIRAIFESITDGITITDLHGNITDFNEATLRLHGLEHRDQLKGRNAFDLIAKTDYPKALENMQRTYINGASGRLEYKFLRGNGTEFDGELNAVLIRDETGQPIGFVALTHDITLRKESEAERERLIAQLEAKNTELENFTYTVSHDLKAPLLTINGFLGFLEKDALTGNSERIKADISRIAEATSKMHRLLTELLELSRIGRMINPPEDVPFNDIVREAIDLAHGRLAAGQVQVRVDENLPVIRCDRARLVEAIQNLIDNAAKFMGDEQKPRIEIGQLDQEAEHGKPVFFIKDNGIGIATKYHERVFGLFNKLNPDIEGTGIGLALVKRIIEVHGGKIWIESEVGRGATFYFTLPMK